MSKNTVERLVINHVNYFDSHKGKMVEGATIVISEGKFAWVGSSADFEMQDGDRIIFGESNYILPGLIDTHVHLEANMESNYEKQYMRTNSSKYCYLALKHAREHLKSGFTTLRDCGGRNWGSTLRGILDEQVFYGSRLVVSQNVIRQWGNTEVFGPDELIAADRRYETMSGVDGVIHAVRERKRSGSDFIKTTTTGGVMHDIASKTEDTLWRDEELEALVDEAHRLGMHVAAHAHGDEGIKRAALANVDTIEHGSYISPETADLLIAREIYLVPTQTSAFVDKPDLMTNLPTEDAIKMKEVDEAMFLNHKMAFKRGVKMALGTDAGVPGNPHGTSAREITSMVKRIKMKPFQALQAATIDAAKAIKMDHLIGSIEAGKIADLILVNSNPIEDVRLLEEKKNILKVVKDGIIMAERGIII